MATKAEVKIFAMLARYNGVAEFGFGFDYSTAVLFFSRYYPK